jgi:hypothetical protein
MLVEEQEASGTMVASRQARQSVGGATTPATTVLGDPQCASEEAMPEE